MAGGTEERRPEMKYRITLEAEVPDGTSIEDAEEYFQYACGYSWRCGEDNPLNDDNCRVTHFDIHDHETV